MSAPKLDPAKPGYVITPAGESRPLVVTADVDLTNPLRTKKIADVYILDVGDTPGTYQSIKPTGEFEGPRLREPGAKLVVQGADPALLEQQAQAFKNGLKKLPRDANGHVSAEDTGKLMKEVFGPTDTRPGINAYTLDKSIFEAKYVNQSGQPVRFGDTGGSFATPAEINSIVSTPVTEPVVVFNENGGLYPLDPASVMGINSKTGKIYGIDTSATPYYALVDNNGAIITQPNGKPYTLADAVDPATGKIYPDPAKNPNVPIFKDYGSQVNIYDALQDVVETASTTKKPVNFRVHGNDYTAYPSDLPLEEQVNDLIHTYSRDKANSLISLPIEYGPDADIMKVADEMVRHANGLNRPVKFSIDGNTYTAHPSDLPFDDQVDALVERYVDNNLHRNTPLKPLTPELQGMVNQIPQAYNDGPKALVKALSEYADEADASGNVSHTALADALEKAGYASNAYVKQSGPFAWDYSPENYAGYVAGQVIKDIRSGRPLNPNIIYQYLEKFDETFP